MADHATPTRLRASLAAQMMLGLAALALLSALVVGLPAIWLMRHQMQSLAWAQVQQGMQASRALYDAQLTELAGLATLTAQRPTLAALLQQEDQDPDALLSYLDTLRQGADLDLITVCGEQGRVLAQVGQAAGTPWVPPFCGATGDGAVLTAQPPGLAPQVWLAASQPLAGDAAVPGSVVAARRLDEGYVQEMRRQTGLDHALLVGGLPTVSSLGGDATVARGAERLGENGLTAFTWKGEPFHGARFPLTAAGSEPTVQHEVALSMAGVIAAQQRLLRWLLVSMALAIALGVALASVLARRISRPLAELTAAAEAMRGGDLSSPVAFDTRVREVALVGQALEATRADLQRTLEALRREKALTDHFLANVSHEFRTPLTAVAAAVELLMDQAPELSLDELQELLATLHLGVLNLQQLVDNLLESANIEAGRFRVHPRPASLAGIIAEAAATMQPLLDRHGQRLVVELPAAIPVVMADPRRVVQVLVNLLSNASNAQRSLPEMAHGQITIGAAVEDDGRTVRVLVADQGPGVPVQQRAELLQGRRFMTAPAVEGAPPGFGLGLPVVRAIVAGHGGQLGIDDRPGGGAVVWFILPRAREVQALGFRETTAGAYTRGATATGEDDESTDRRR